MPGTLICEIGFGCGGLGDRIVGLVSAILLAKLSRRELVIRWESPNMDAIWENRFRGDPKLRPRNDDIHWNFVDQRFKYRRELEKTPLDVLWPRHRNVYLKGNQEIASFAYGNHNGGESHPDAFLRDITSTYADLFIKYLAVREPKPMIPLPPETGLSLGIQIRTGDTHMKAGHVEYISAEALKNNILPEIVKFIAGFASPTPISSIFVTSDFPHCAALLQDQLAAAGKKYMVFSNETATPLVTHVDRPGASVAGLRSTVLDLQQLAACQIQLFSWVSNFGRVAALMGLGFANQNNDRHATPELYTLYGNRIVPVGNNPAALTTKHQQIRDQVTPPPL